MFPEDHARGEHQWAAGHTDAVRALEELEACNRALFGIAAGLAAGIRAGTVGDAEAYEMLLCLHQRQLSVHQRLYSALKPSHTANR
jgi:hypothetical protein